MARNKYPEETVNQIITVALQLFLKNGYEQTSIQDIISNLGGLSKGAIYHHFKSKEEILMAVCERLYEGTDKQFLEIKNEKGLTGKQKLQKLFRSSLENPNQEIIFSTAPNLLKFSQFLAIQIENIMKEVVPIYILPIIEEGINDGSIQIKYPKQAAEAVMLLANFWMNPMICDCTKEEYLNRGKVLKEIFISMGLDVLSEDLLDRLNNFQSLYEKRKDLVK